VVSRSVTTELASGPDHGETGAFVMEETTPAVAGKPRGRHVLPRLGLGRSGPSGADAAVSVAMAAIVTVGFLAAVGVATGQAFRRSVSDARDAERAQAGERLVYVTTSQPLDPSAAPAESPVTRSSANRAPERAAPAPLAAPTSPIPRDSVGAGSVPATPTGRSAAERMFPLGVPVSGALPSPGRLGESIGDAVGAGTARSGCAAPCREAAVAGAAPGTELARRDSIIGARMQEVVGRAGPAQKPPGFQIGLPGGGPTREERQRDSTLHADYRKRLEILLTRYDSLRADSIARRLIREPPPF
jgi:hypothetical protein